jgi:hypothetical protein
LGLWLSKSIVNLFGGKIKIESVVDEGTTFVVTFPVKPVQGYSVDEETDRQEPDDLAPIKQRLLGSHVVVVEDLTYS